MTRTFNDLYLHDLQMLVSAETQMIALLPVLAQGTDTHELQVALASQQQVCREQLAMLQRLIEDLAQPPAAPVNRGTQALLQECSELLKTFPAGNLRDAVMIAHMQRAEHYKMAAYATVHDYAKLLGDKAGAERLGQAGKTFTGISRTLGAIAIQVNAEAYVDTRVEGT